MQVKEFLAAVLPPQGHGYYCAVELSTPRREHKFVETLDELIEAANSFDSAKHDAYYGVSTYATSANRTVANSSQIKSIFADIDCGSGKNYPDIASALEGLNGWLTGSGFPTPYVVASGGGLHVYWPFTEAIPTADWKPVADLFKRATQVHNFNIDFSVSGDIARVLRVPNTFNYKQPVPRKVRIKLEGEAHPFAHYARLLEQYTEKKQALAQVNFDPLLDQAPSFATGHSSYATDLAAITECDFDQIIALGEKGCKQIVHYIKNAAQEGMEPLWRAAMSTAKFCVDGESKARWLASLHPYDDVRFANKYSDIKGPYNCSAYAGTSPGICEGCDHFGKVSNPINLGKKLKEQESASAVFGEGSAIPVRPTDSADPTGVSGLGPRPFVFPDAPRGFKLFPTGVAAEHVDKEGYTHVALVTDIPFFATHNYEREGERYIQFTIYEHGKTRSEVFALAGLASKDKSVELFAKKGVVIHNGQDMLFRSYLKATIAEAKKNPPIAMPTNLGWQKDDTFAYNNRLYTANGETDVPMPGFDNINATIGTKGTLDGWRIIINSVARLERWDLLSIMCMSFASPLMRFTGLNGLTFHLCGNNSGRGKTLAQRLASSVWGAPDKFRVVPNTSPVAMVNRLGMLGNLPLLVDEITHKGRNEAEWFPEFLSQMSDGRGKDRMEASTNSERRNTTTWSSLALMTSNKHMLDYLTAERNHGSEGEIRRLIEIVFDREFDADELTKSLLYTSLPENYGAAGEAYAKWLVRNVDTARRVTRDTYDEVFAAFHATGDERFWIAGCACIIASVRLISSSHAGIIDLDLRSIGKFLYKAVLHMRVETRRTKRKAIDVLNEFTKRNYGKLVVVNERVARIAGLEIAETLDRKDLCGRVEKIVGQDWIDYYIEEKELKAFCSSLSYGYAEFKKDLGEDFPLRYGMKNLLMGTKGPSMNVRCIHVKQKSDVASVFTEKAANE